MNSRPSGLWGCGCAVIGPHHDTTLFLRIGRDVVADRRLERVLRGPPVLAVHIALRDVHDLHAVRVHGDAAAPHAIPLRRSVCAGHLFQKPERRVALLLAPVSAGPALYFPLDKRHRIVRRRCYVAVALPTGSFPHLRRDETTGVRFTDLASPKKRWSLKNILFSQEEEPITVSIQAIHDLLIFVRAKTVHGRLAAQVKP